MREYKSLFLAMGIALFLCYFQVLGKDFLIYAVLATFIILLAWSFMNNFGLPIMLFFLPWSPLMRSNVETFSFYTLGLILVCVLCVWRSKLKFDGYQLMIGLLMMIVTLFSKLISGYGIAVEYFVFVMMFILFPSIRNEGRGREDIFFNVTIFYSVGIITAALSAMFFVDYPNISKFIRVDSYTTIVRMCGFYGDPNFYIAQITAAFGGILILMLDTKNKIHRRWAAVIAVLLLYCGFLSGSKSFILTTTGVVVLWVIAVLQNKEKGIYKIMILSASIGVVFFIGTSELFSNLIDVVITRLTYGNTLSDFTTGRTDLWEIYLDAILGDAKILLIGEGFTNVKVGGRGSHNTIIQIVYQFGVLGGPLLIVGMSKFYKGLYSAKRRDKIYLLKKSILLIGVFLPWLAIDILFFDEFFLMQLYVYSGLQYNADQEYKMLPIVAESRIKL